jgi:hypothetical protein
MPVPSPLSTVPEPSNEEQLRQLAAAVKDLYHVMEIIVTHAEQFVPGEAVDELKDAWYETEAAAIDRIIPDVLTNQNIRSGLEQNGLLGKSGKLKRSMAGRLKDKFYEWFHLSNKTNHDSKNTAEAAGSYLETLENIMKSIPGAHAVEEFVGTTKQLVMLWARRRA